MKRRALVKWFGGIVALSVAIAVSHGTTTADVERKSGDIIMADTARSLAKSCLVAGMGAAHDGSVTVLLKNETFFFVMGEEARPFFFEMVAAIDARTPDRCQIWFTIE
jgi:hypothetical protein